MLTELERTIDEHSNNLNKELENIKKNQSELKNTITKMINILRYRHTIFHSMKSETLTG